MALCFNTVVFLLCMDSYCFSQDLSLAAHTEVWGPIKIYFNLATDVEITIIIMIFFFRFSYMLLDKPTCPLKWMGFSSLANFSKSKTNQSVDIKNLDLMYCIGETFRNKMLYSSRKYYLNVAYGMHNNLCLTEGPLTLCGSLEKKEIKSMCEM